MSNYSSFTGDKKVTFKSFMDFLNKKEKEKKCLLWSFMACF